MPSDHQNCGICGEQIACRNLQRHLRRWHTPKDDEHPLDIDASCRPKSSTIKRARSLSNESRRSSSTGSTIKTSNSVQGTSSSVKNISSTSESQPTINYLHDASLCMLRRTNGVNVTDLVRYLEIYFPLIPAEGRLPLVIGTFAAAQRAALAYADILMGAEPDRVNSAKRSLTRWMHGLSAVEPGQIQNKCPDQLSPSHIHQVEAYSPSTNYQLPVPMDSTFGQADFQV